MISTMLSPASAGAFGPWSADVRPYACEAVRIALLPTAAAVQGTGLPAAGVSGPDALRTDITDKQHTLGIHPPGRPQS